MEQLKILYNQKEYSSGDNISPYQLLKPPTVQFNWQPKKLYTLIMIDRDAPMVDNPYNKYWLHWMMVNNKEIPYDYVPPGPQYETGIHRYYILLFEQLDDIKVSPYQPRAKFDLLDFWIKHNLVLKGGFCFKSRYETIL